MAAVIIKHQLGVRCCGHRAGLFCYCFAATGERAAGKEGQAGSVLRSGGAAAPGLARLRMLPPIYDTAYLPPQDTERQQKHPFPTQQTVVWLISYTVFMVAQFNSKRTEI
ncbi:MAG: hypothetical protein A2X28_03585 [Elusimicrobia bacterium GWA2_56_46]|nr:MAG: hypothetical protein A2X28_03585 [Elusimicrobia bacterium GWA2_56_46]OGR54960.1 MAG: hypothetical protein A2X39_02520 [Elusimicrobia bacterium GWC2_56_31]